jgi:murein L,D-transpeptidase YcbB/YkuD
VRQPPGERNALGYVKFIFPNNHAVYLHDTPSRHLFAREQRAFSHGCVRVDQPFRLAEAVLQVQGDWSEAKLRGLIGKGERHLRLKDRLPVHLSYFTLAVDESGQLKSFNDLYGHNARVREALGLPG